MKKVLIVGSPHIGLSHKLAEIIKEHPEITVVNHPDEIDDGVPIGSTTLPDLTPEPVMYVPSPRVEPEYFPPSKSKFHK